MKWNNMNIDEFEKFVLDNSFLTDYLENKCGTPKDEQLHESDRMKHIFLFSCPFCDPNKEKAELTYSFGLRSYFYCRACKAEGNTIDFVMRTQNLSKDEVLEKIVNRYDLKDEYEKYFRKKEISAITSPKRKKVNKPSKNYKTEKSLNKCAAYLRKLNNRLDVLGFELEELKMQITPIFHVLEEFNPKEEPIKDDIM